MPVINLARQCFSSERRNVAYPVVSAQGSTPDSCKKYHLDNNLRRKHTI
jgi:hypothetical protein